MTGSHSRSRPRSRARTGRRPSSRRTTDRPRSRRTRWIGRIVAGLLAAIGTLCVLLRLVPSWQLGLPLVGLAPAVTLFASFIDYGLLAWIGVLVVVIIAIARTDRPAVLGLAAVTAATAIVLQTGWIAPQFRADRDHEPSRTFTVLSLNTYFGRADPQQLATRADDAHADIVVLLELTAAEAAALERIPSWRERFRYRIGRPVPTGTDGSGSAVYSRFPIRSSSRLPTTLQQWVASITIPRIGPVTVIAAHPCPLMCEGTGTWRHELDALRMAAEDHGNGPVVVAGDFNAVDAHLPMIDFHSAGFRSAADVAGAGWQPTYPSGWIIPPIIGIDHVLINRDLTARSVRRTTVRGTDHRGLIAVLGVR